MNEYLLLMHAGAPGEPAHTWPAYLATLQATGVFEGGSAIGDGISVSKAGGAVNNNARPLVGHIRVRPESLAGAQSLLAGNPVFEGGGTVEIRELTRG